MQTIQLIPLVLFFGCGPGTGTASFTTWGEDFVERQIPPDPGGEAGFVDGWTLRYQKFLVTFHALEIADSDGTLGARFEGSVLVDNTKPGRKELVRFSDVEARAFDSVSYEIKPATPSSTLLGATEADRAMMVEHGYSIYLAGAATKTGTAGQAITKTFHLGFALGTKYSACQQPAESGHAIVGIVVTDGGSDVSELTTHGDHPYYDRLKASPDPAIQTVLRFDEKAAADADGDGELTMEELDQARIDVRKYDPSGFDAPNLGAFMRALARTIGHFRGEGECQISQVE
ncbi:MAG: hypothetical protein U1E65_09185 [Myxococcota bacterium]